MRRGARCPYALYLGGVAGALLVGWSRAFGVGAGGVDRDVWLVPALGGAFLVSHYGLQALQEWLGGSAARAGAPAQRAVGVVAEATLLAAGVGDRAHLGAASAGAVRAARRHVSARQLRLQAARGARRPICGCASSSSRRSIARRTRSAPRSRRRRCCTRCLRETARALPLRRSHRRHRRDRRRAACAIGCSAASCRCSRPTTRAQAALAAPAPRARRRASTIPLRPERARAHGRAARDVRRDAPARSSPSRATTRRSGRTSCACFDAIGGQAAAAVENARLYALANVDGLTGLYVRRYFDLRVQRRSSARVASARRSRWSCSTSTTSSGSTTRLGHLAGDRALREVAALAAAAAARRRSGGALRRRRAGVPVAAHVAGRRARGGRAHPRGHQHSTDFGRRSTASPRRSASPAGPKSGVTRSRAARRARGRGALSRQGGGQKSRRDRSRQLRADAVVGTGHRRYD